MLLGACGRIGFAEHDNTAAPDIPDRCAAELVELGPFGAPTLIAAASGATSMDDDPEPSDDGLELFFNSTRAGGLGGADIYVLTRATSQAAWAAPQHVIELSSGGSENTLELSADGLTMWLVSTRPGGAGMDDIWIATRSSRGGAWSTPTNVPELNSAQFDRGPTVFHDGLAMWLHSDRQSPQQFYQTTRASTTTAWSVPTRVTSPAGYRGWMSPCGLELYFQAGTQVDFFLARRASIDDPFGAAVRIDELSSPDFDQDLRLSPDRRRAYFSSSRANGVDNQLYEASR
jgi:Tol biopolymer transport system component